MQIRKFFWIVLSLFSTIVLFACDGGGGSSGGGTSADGGTGTVSFSLTDSTTDQYRGVYITIIDLQICSNRGGTSDPPDNDCNWMSLDPPDGMQFPLTYNLLKLVNGVTEAIGSGEFSAGEYHQVRLIIGHQPELENNLLGEPHPEANYVILNDGNDTIKPLKVPSGPETGLKLVHSFTVGDEEVKELILDFDACRSVVKAGNSGIYILKPTIKVIDSEDKIYIDGTVTDNSDPRNPPIGGASVSAQISDGLSATVVRSTITDGADTENDLQEGEYILTLLSPDQIYNIVAYSDGKSPQCIAFRYNDPDFQFPDLPLEFALSEPAASVTVSGGVIVDGVTENFPLVITVYTELDCAHPDGEGYVELTQVLNENITETSSGVFEYTIDLPTYDFAVTYYVVASAEGYIPDTGTAVASAGDIEVNVDPDSLVISPIE
jgi:hypothetical protein